METQPTRAECAPKPSPRKRGRTLVDAWRQSGLSQRAFARQQQVRPHLVSYWARRFPEPTPTTASAQAPATTANVDFVEIRAPSPAPSACEQSCSAIEIIFASGVVVRIPPGADPALLRVVVSALVGA